MPGAYQIPLDIANRALDHIGATPITSFTQDVKAAQRVSSVYDKVRDAELRRNVWRFAIRKVALRAVDTTTVFLVPSAYVAADTYPQSSIVTFNNITYISAQYVPINTPPGNPNEAFWWVYFGPLTVQPWNPSPLVVPTPVTYYAGELVYNLVGTTVNVYQCLTTGTLADPTAAPPLWLATTTYDIGDTVTDAFAVVWQSKIDLNLNNAPVAGIAWQLVPADQPAQEVGQDWLQINATVRSQRFQYPIGSGPRNQSTTRNAFRLPSGYLREAPQDPKAGAVSYLGMPSGLPQDDWEFEGDFIVTRDVVVIVLRFVADIQDVTRMDPMFCEGLAARMGLELCEPLTQSSEKLQAIGSIYKLTMGEARAVNGIETGPTEAPLDDYIATRI